MIAALYIRVSSSEQIKGYSLDAQEDLLRRYAADHNMPVYKLYADEGKSANKALHKRTALLEMVKDAEAKRFDTILFKDITRWSRRSADYFVIQDRLDKCGCAWIAVEQPFLETRTPTGKFQVSIMLGVSQLESENNSQRVKFVRDNMVKNGVVPYSDRQAPIGYKVAEIDGIRRLIKDPKTSDMVTDMFRYLWDHRNAAATRRYVQEKYGIAFTSTYFSKVTKREVYVGRYRGIEGFCEPYITEEMHQFFANRKSWKADAKYTDQYIFRGMLRCRCGRTMQPSLIRNHIYYRCAANYVEHKCDMNHSVRQDRLEQLVLKEIRPAFDAYRYKVTVLQKEADNSKRIETLRAKLKRLNELYIDGAIEKADYDTKRASYNAELSRLEPARAVDTTALENLLNQPWESLYGDLDADGKSAFWMSMIDYITWDGANISIEFKN